jgi:hypothetical protein
MRRDASPFVTNCNDPLTAPPMILTTDIGAVGNTIKSVRRWPGQTKFGTEGSAISDDPGVTNLGHHTCHHVVEIAAANFIMQFQKFR